MRFARGPQGRTWAVPDKGQPVPIDSRVLKAMAQRTRSAATIGGLSGTYGGTIGGGALGAGTGYGLARLLGSSTKGRAIGAVGGALAGSFPGALAGAAMGATSARKRSVDQNKAFLKRYVSQVGEAQKRKLAMVGAPPATMSASPAGPTASAPAQTMQAPKSTTSSPAMASPSLPKLSSLRLEKVGQDIGAMMAKTALNPVVVGAAIGAGIGAGIGALTIRPDESESGWKTRTRGGLIGAGVGAATGGGIGAISVGAATPEKIDMAIHGGRRMGAESVGRKIHDALGERGARKLMDRIRKV